MYKISIDGLFIFDDITPLEDYKLINPKLTLAVNSSGNLSFKMPPSNRGYAAGRRLSSVVIVYKNSNKNVDEDVEYWRGRIVTESVDMLGNRDIYCEGELAYLNDTHQPQANYAGMGISVRTFLENLIQNHNDAVSGEAGMSLPNKKFRVGNVTVTDTGETGQDTIYRMTNWETTWDCIQDKLIDRLGGYLYLRKVYDPLMDQVVTYIDYLKDPKTPANPQKIEFGKNLIDFTRNFDGSTIKTVIVPFGAALEEERIPGLTSYLDVKSVNNNSLYVYNQSMVDVWGWIEEVVHWDDVTKPQNLLNKARAYLTSTQFEYMVIDVNAIDLNRLNPDISSLEVGTVVNVTSDVHNLNMDMVVSKAVLRLDDPSQDEYTLGKEKRSPSLSDSVQTNIAKNYKATEERANDISNLKQVAVTDVAVLYAQSEAEDLPPVEGWSPVAPSHEDGKFMWQKTVVTKANETAETSDPTNITGAKGDAGADGDMGPQGISVVEVETQYYLSASNQTPTGGSWSSSEPAYVSGRYYWTRLKTTFSDSSVEYTDAELAQGLTNANQVAALADSKADDISRGLITNYYTKTETDQSFQELEGEILSTVSETYVENSTYVTDIDNLQQQIDGAIESFTGSVEPTLSNYPASDWTTNKEKDKHIGDLYLVNSSGGTKAGFYYRFEKDGSTYKWVHIPDNEVQKALEDAAEANAKAIAAQNAADGVAEDLAQNYLTTSEVNSAIDQKAAEITLSVSQTYATQNTVTNVKNSTIKSDTLHYLATSASSGVTRNTSGWTTTVQAMTQTKQYLWTYHTYTYGDDHVSYTDPIITGRYGQNGTDGAKGDKGDKGDKGNTGDTGVGIAEVISLRYTSNSTTAPSKPTSNVTSTATTAKQWTRAIPALDSTNKYMWTCDQIEYSNNTYEWTTVVRDDALTNLTEKVHQAEIKLEPNAIVSTVKASNTFTTVDEFNALEIGGRNLIRGTADMVIATQSRWENGNFRKSGTGTITTVDITDSPVSGVTKGIEITTPNANAQIGFCQDGFPMNGLIGKTLAYSFWVKGHSGDRVTVQAYWTNQSGAGESDAINVILTDDKWTKVTRVTNAIKYDHVGVSIAYVYLYPATGGTSAIVCGQKLEVGNKFTDWSPAPEDMASKSEIKQLSNQIVMKVKSGNILTSVALSADPDTGSAFKVKADNIDIISNGNIQLTGKSIGITSTNFTVTPAGAVTCKDLALTGGEINLGNGVFKVTNAGALTATSGTVAGWNIDSTGLSKTVGNHTARIYPSQIQVTNGEYLTTITSSSIITEDVETRIFHCGHIVTEQPYVTDLNIDSDGNMNTRGTVTASKVNGCKFKAGSKVVSTTGNTSTAIFTNTELNTLLGVTNSTNTNTVVLASNGDGGAQSAHAEGCTYKNNTWYVTHDRAATAGNMRLNYLVFYWG